MKRIAVIVGTRPEIVKLAPVLRELGNRGVLIHTGQHYDRSMSAQFFEEFGIGTPDVVLDGVGGVGRTEQIATAMLGLRDLLDPATIGAVIVQGDTNTVSAAAQVANYAGIPVVHVEAGLRSHDRLMPEEINRQVAGVLADVHCAPTQTNVDNLLAEGVPAARVHLTGNTIVEATEWSMAQERPILPLADTVIEESVLATIHRPENTDDADALTRALSGLAAIDAPVILVLHPRTRAAIVRFGLARLLQPLVCIAPVSHRQLLAMMQAARLVISDSGGLQEECTIVKTPLLVLRRSTERPESVAAGFSTLITPEDDLVAAADALLQAPPRLDGMPSPYGDGTASRRIAQLAIDLAGAVAPAPLMGALAHV